MYVTYRYEKDAAEKQITYSKEGYKDTRKISLFQLFKKFSVFPFFKFSTTQIYLVITGFVVHSCAILNMMTCFGAEFCIYYSYSAQHTNVVPKHIQNST